MSHARDKLKLEFEDSCVFDECISENFLNLWNFSLLVAFDWLPFLRGTIRSKHVWWMTSKEIAKTKSTPIIHDLGLSPLLIGLRFPKSPTLHNFPAVQLKVNFLIWQKIPVHNFFELVRVQRLTQYSINYVLSYLLSKCQKRFSVFDSNYGWKAPTD